MTFLLFVIGTEWIVVLVVAAILLLFGGSKLPQLAKALGQSKKRSAKGWTKASAKRRARANLILLTTKRCSKKRVAARSS